MEKEIKKIEEEIKSYSDSSKGGIEKFRINFVSKKSIINKIFEDGQSKYGPREWSPNIIKRLEDATGISVLAPGFPDEIIDDEAPEEGYEVIPTGSEKT